MRSGEEVVISNAQMLEPQIGKLVDVTVEGETVRARITKVDSWHTTIKVVPNSTKE